MPTDYGLEPPIEKTILCAGDLHRYCDGALVWFTPEIPDIDILRATPAFKTIRHESQCQCACHPLGPIAARLYAHKAG